MTSEQVHCCLFSECIDDDLLTGFLGCEFLGKIGKQLHEALIVIDYGFVECRRRAAAYESCSRRIVDDQGWCERDQKRFNILARYTRFRAGFKQERLMRFEPLSAIFTLAGKATG